jgi:hypothetical protein
MCSKQRVQNEKLKYNKEARNRKTELERTEKSNTHFLRNSILLLLYLRLYFAAFFLFAFRNTSNGHNIKRKECNSKAKRSVDAVTSKKHVKMFNSIFERNIYTYTMKRAFNTYRCTFQALNNIFFTKVMSDSSNDLKLVQRPDTVESSKKKTTLMLVFA